MFCIGIYRRSRSSYNFLSKYLLCPSATTLDTQLRNIPLNSGYNNIIFKYLKLVAKEVEEKELCCALIWDEMSIQPAVYYDSKKDKIIGFEDWGMRRTRKFADHAIVFYVRCLASGNHMPIGYGFCQSTTNTVQLVWCIKQWLTTLIKCGFKPVATVCDQGATNVAAINWLIKEANNLRRISHKNPRNTFLIEKKEIIPLYDYVHLQKGVRNNLLTKDLRIKTNIKLNNQQFISWDDIITIYEMDKYSFLRQRQMPKLTDKHIFPNLIPKMRVKYATQVLSHTVANFIDVVLTFRQGIMDTKKGQMQLSSNANATSEAIIFFDDLFDSFNGKKGQGLTSIVSNTSNHISFWEKAYDKLRHMEYVEKTTHKIIRKHSPKCLINWMWTIRSAKYLWNVLQISGFSSFNLKHINQDVLENCFSQIRDNGHRNVNPSPFQFSAAFKTIVTTNLTSNHCISSNCEESKEGTSLALINMCRANEIIKESDTEQNNDIACAEAAIPDIITTNMFVDAQKIIFLIEKEKCIMDCEECFQIIKHNNILENIQRALDQAEIKFPEFCHEIQVKEKLKNILNNAFSPTMMHCSIVRNIIIEVTAKVFILQWCKFINKILTGKIQEECDNNYIYNQARRMYLKHKRSKSQV